MDLDYSQAVNTLTGPWLERRDQGATVAKLRQMTATVLARPTESATVNIHARAVYRSLAHMKELARVAEAKGREGFALNVAAAADSMWSSLQVLIAETNGAVPTCCHCRGALTASTAGAVWLDDDTRTLCHANPSMCGREIMEMAS